MKFFYLILSIVSLSSQHAAARKFSEEIALSRLKMETDNPTLSLKKAKTHPKWELTHENARELSGAMKKEAKNMAWNKVRQKEGDSALSFNDAQSSRHWKSAYRDAKKSLLKQDADAYAKDLRQDPTKAIERMRHFREKKREQRASDNKKPWKEWHQKRRKPKLPAIEEEN